MLISARRSVLFVMTVGLSVGGCTHPPAFWTKDHQTMTFSIANLDSVEITTHDGDIHVLGDDNAQDIQVTVDKAAGGRTPRDAQACAEAAKVFTKQVGTTQKVGWKWKVVRPLRWRARVSFEVRLPKRLASVAHARNGEIRLEGVDGGIRLVTHNGSVVAEDFTGDADIETHNGSIDAKGRPDHLRLVTHTGSIEA